MKERIEEYIIDRFEGEVAVCESPDGTMMEFALADLPDDVREGDVVGLDATGLRLLDKETQRRKTRIEKKIDDLFID